MLSFFFGFDLSRGALRLVRVQLYVFVFSVGNNAVSAVNLGLLALEGLSRCLQQRYLRRLCAATSLLTLLRIGALCLGGNLPRCIGVVSTVLCLAQWDVFRPMLFQSCTLVTDPQEYSVVSVHGVEFMLLTRMPGETELQ